MTDPQAPQQRSDEELRETVALIERWAAGFEGDDIVRAYRKLLHELDRVKAERAAIQRCGECGAEMVPASFFEAVDAKVEERVPKLQVRVTELRAERDAAYARGAEAMRRAVADRWPDLFGGPIASLLLAQLIPAKPPSGEPSEASKSKSVIKRERVQRGECMLCGKPEHSGDCGQPPRGAGRNEG